jgi:cell division protein FtsL
MIKVNHILILLSVLGVIFFNYEIKNNYHLKEKEIIKLNNLILEKKQTINVMKAELAYLSRPERLQLIAKQQLNMKEILPTDIWNINNISKLYFEKK